MSLTHQAVLVELPVLVSVGAEPASRIIVVFVSEPDRDTIARERPQFLDEPVVEFPAPFAFQELDDLGPSLKDFAAVSPLAVDRIGSRHAFGIAGVPGILGGTNLLDRGLPRERRKRGAYFCHVDPPDGGAASVESERRHLPTSNLQGLSGGRPAPAVRRTSRVDGSSQVVLPARPPPMLSRRLPRSVAEPSAWFARRPRRPADRIDTPERSGGAGEPDPEGV